jgi:Flp pilus assembly pilin Flp
MARALLDGRKDAPADPKRRPRLDSVDDGRRGPSAIEYCQVAALIGAALIAGLSALGASFETNIDAIAAAIAAPKP